VLVEAFVAEAAIEALDEGVLDRPARLDEVEMDVVLVGREVEGPTGELGAVGSDQAIPGWSDWPGVQ